MNDCINKTKLLHHIDEYCRVRRQNDIQPLLTFDEVVSLILEVPTESVTKDGTNFVEVVRCKDCKHGRPTDKTKAPEKYYKDDCVVCECEDVVGDEPMVYLPSHFCGCGQRKCKVVFVRQNNV